MLRYAKKLIFNKKKKKININDKIQILYEKCILFFILYNKN